MRPLRQRPLNEVPPKLYAKGDLFKRKLHGFHTLIGADKNYYMFVIYLARFIVLDDVANIIAGSQGVIQMKKLIGGLAVVLIGGGFGVMIAAAPPSDLYGAAALAASRPDWALGGIIVIGLGSILLVISGHRPLPCRH